MPNRHIERMINELKNINNNLQLRVNNLEKKLKEIDSLKRENAKLKEEITNLKNELAERPPTGKKTSIPLTSLLKNLNTAILNFETSSIPTVGKINKNYKISNLEIDLKSLVEIEEDDIKISTPLLGEKIDPNILSNIKLKLSPSFVPSKGEWIGVPNLIGMSLEDAQKVLDKKGLKYQVDEEESIYPKGTVINQIPEPYSEIKAEYKMELIVSKGK